MEVHTSMLVYCVTHMWWYQDRLVLAKSRVRSEEQRKAFVPFFVESIIETQRYCEMLGLYCYRGW